MVLQKEKGVFPPKEGWEEHTYYIVSVSYAPNSLVHQAILWVDEIDKSLPGCYSRLYSMAYEGVIPFDRVWYLKVDKKIGRIKDEIQCC